MTAAHQSDVDIKIFSYGTLQQAEVQLKVFGRLLVGKEDFLTGFRLNYVTITDPEVIADSGRSEHPALVREPGCGDRIVGIALEVDRKDLPAVDAYESEHYHRILVTLDSGASAFVYIDRRCP